MQNSCAHEISLFLCSQFDLFIFSVHKNDLYRNVCIDFIATHKFLNVCLYFMFHDDCLFTCNASGFYFTQNQGENASKRINSSC